MGHDRIPEEIDHLLTLKTHTLSIIKQNPHFRLLAPAPYLNVLFRFEAEPAMQADELDQLNIKLCKTLLRENLGFVDYTRHKGKIGIRYILANEQMNRECVEQFLSHCERIGHALS